MFGLVTANLPELSAEEKDRYTGVYCGICRRIKAQSSNLCRLGLRYDMAFLSLLLMSLYEPDEEHGDRACKLHPLKPRPWTDCDAIRYAADMNVALAFYKFRDDRQDDKNIAAGWMEGIFAPHAQAIAERYPRQCAAIRDCIEELDRLEKENCPNPDDVAGCFGQLMGDLLVYKEDLWTPSLREMGMALGRFIYLADAAIDYHKDTRKKKYNPYLAMGTGEDWPRWEEYLVLAMSRCTEYYERLPLVQDKAILDNILYSGVWTNFGRLRKKAGEDA